MPQAGRPSPQAGGFESQPRGGAPRAGGPSAGRPSAGGPAAGRGQQPYQSPQRHSPQPGGYESPSGPVTGSSPRTDQWGAGSPPLREAGQAPRGGDYRQRPEDVSGGATQQHDQPFEEAAFADDGAKGDWGGGEADDRERLGYMPKEPRRRSDFQKVRSRARKSSPWPKIAAAVVALALVGGGTWWFLNSRDGEETGATGENSNLTYAGSDEPCSLADAGELESLVDGPEPVAAPEAEDKNSGWVQSCTLTYGEPQQAAALLKIEGTVFESDARASVNFELSTGEIAEMTDQWVPVDPAPEIGDQSAAVARVVSDGTSNYHLHLQDDNVYLVVRLAVAKDTPMDEQGLTDLTTALASAYLENWRDAS
ncbi:hypothetical protein LO763_28445 [Glycomyces sp. A-F 0318]|uniref:hypothetical protein n=1 Tax=Glycomyces amatae TaxID=2881355 RepID=UPI001E50E4BF|nr:hypothetical protein [Glycomyces amatae]MCD0447552.1 hypothetical protein [Glycomyces amatae]